MVLPGFLCSQQLRGAAREPGRQLLRLAVAAEALAVCVVQAAATGPVVWPLGELVFYMLCTSYDKVESNFFIVLSIIILLFLLYYYVYYYIIFIFSLLYIHIYLY